MLATGGRISISGCTFYNDDSPALTFRNVEEASVTHNVFQGVALVFENDEPEPERHGPSRFAIIAAIAGAAALGVGAWLGFR